MLRGPVVALIGSQAGEDSPRVTGSQLVFEVEGHVEASGHQVPHCVGSDGRVAPVVGPVGPGRGDGPPELAVWVGLGLRLELREEPRDAVGVLRLPRPRLDAVSHVTPPALFVGGEGGTPDAPRGGKLCPIPVGDVANALVGQGVAPVATLSSLLDKPPCIDEASHHLADTPLRDAEPCGKVLAGDHWVVGDDVQRPLLRRADAEGRRSLGHALRVGYRSPLALRRRGEGSSSSARCTPGDHVLQRVVRVPEQPRGLLPDAAVPSFQHPPGLHGDEEVPEIDSLAEPPRQPPLPHAGDQDEHDVGASAGVVLR